MKSEAVFKFFGSKSKAARALGISPQAITWWGDEVPKTRQAHVRDAMTIEMWRREAEATAASCSIDSEGSSDGK